MSGLLIYDGDCGFCTSTAAWMQARFVDGIRVESWQSVEMADFGLTDQNGQESSWWIDDEGSAVGGAQGIGWALRSTKPAWAQLAGRFITFAPVRPVSKLAYKVIVRYRHKLPGSTDACRMHYD